MSDIASAFPTYQTPSALTSYLSSIPLANTSGLQAPTTGLVPTNYTAAPANFDLSSLGPLQSGLPAATTSFNAKYAPGNVLSRTLSSPVYNALQAYDQIRLQRGQAPLSQALTADVSTAAETGQAQAPNPEPSNIFEAGLNDIKQIVGAVPAIPGQIVNTLQQLPDINNRVAQIQQQAKGDLGQELSGYLQLPGINMIPGTYTASNLVKGDYGQLLQHPVMTALDVLPYANKLAEAAPAVRAAEAEAADVAARQSEAAGIPVAPKQVRSIPTALTRTVDDLGQVQPNILGRGINAITDALAQTKPGQLAQEAWSPDARLAARIVNDVQADLVDQMSPSGKRFTEDPQVMLMRNIQDIGNKYPLDEAAKTQVTEHMMDPVNHPLDTANMSADQLAYRDAIQDYTDRAKVVLNPDQSLVDRPWYGGEETFTSSQAKRLDLQDNRLNEYQQGLNTRRFNEQKLAGFQSKLADTDTGKLLDNLQPLRRTDPVANRFVYFMKAEDYGRALGQLRGMKGAKWDAVFGDLNRNAIRSDLNALNETVKTLTSYKSYTDRGLQSRMARADAARRRITPARWGGVQDAETKAALSRLVSADDYRVANGIDDQALQNYLTYIDQGDMTSLLGNSPVTHGDYLGAVNEAKQTVADMAAKGIEPPVFLHRVSPDMAKQMDFPSVFGTKTTPSSLKDRGIDLTPYVPDYQVALKHQAFEFLHRRAIDETMSRLDATFGRTKTDLWNELKPQVDARLARNPSLNVNAEMERLLKRNGWTRFETETYTPWQKSASTIAGTEDRYIPSAIANNLKRMSDPSKFVATFDPIMKAFRTSVLPLSPRWLVNNIFGGLFMMMGETDPLALAKMGEAWKMVQSGEFENLPGLRNRGASDIAPEEMTQQIAKMTDHDKVSALYNYKGGQFIRRLIDSNGGSKFLSTYGKTIQGIYNVNSFTDDLFRAMTYLRENEKALAKGATETEASAKGIAMARRIMQNWDELTPLERTGLRFAFPFYGFMQHVMRYVYRYPFDHPIRTSILGSFARNELADMGTGLPQQFMSMIWLGGQDEQGNRKAINLSGANPFTIAGDSMTLAGLLGQTNPIVSSLASTLGLDPVSGTTDLYPNVKYNPETGKLEAQQKNYLSTLVGNTVPLTNLVGDLLPTNRDFRELLATNPSAAGRQLFANAGIPSIFQTRNVPQEIIKAEKNRVDAQNTVKSNALKTGDFSEAAQYPALQAWMGQLQQLGATGQLSKYQPKPAQVPNPANALSASMFGYAPQQPAAMSAYQSQVATLSR